MRKKRKTQQALRKMKLFALFMFLGFCTCRATVSAQDARIDLEMSNVTLSQVFQRIEQLTDYMFIYKSEDVRAIQHVTVDARQMMVRDVLEKCLENTGLSYVFKRNVIVIQKAVKDELEKNIVRISGKVTDEKDEPLPGVTVFVKGFIRGVGTSTDNAGRYSVSVPKVEKLSLVFSFVGMEPKEIMYTGQDTINVVLREMVNEMDEVTVVSTGYQTVNRKDMVGSYTTLKAEDIMLPAYSSIDQMLQGQVAGMVITNSSARAGASPKIQIRGTSTILGNQDPIWVIDGIIQDDPIEINAGTGLIDDMRNIIGNQVSWLNPNDIETITVLKDASATAIYGSRASNGVIVITTKKGKKDRLSINYTGNISISPAPRYDQFNVMNSQERVHFSEEAYNFGVRYQKTPIKQLHTYEGTLRMLMEGDITQDEYIANRNRLEVMNTDWLDILTRTAISHNHNLSVSGATSKVNYMISAGYSKNNGQEIGNSSERFTSRASVGIQFNEQIRVNFALDGTVGKNIGYAAGVNPLNYALTTSRALPAYNEDGSYAFYRIENTYKYNTSAQPDGLGFNILNELENSGSEVKNGRIGINLSFFWKLYPWLEYQFTGGYTYNNINSQSYVGENTYAIANKYRGYDYGTINPDDPWFNAAVLPFGGELFTSNATQNSYNIQNKLLISKSFNEDHRLNVMLGVEVRSTKNDNLSNTLWGYVKDRGNMLVRPTAQDKFTPIGSASQSGLGDIFDQIYSGKSKVESKTDNFFSVFATLAYSLKNRYVLNLNVRNDASNRFGQDVNNRFDPTYSLGLSWRVTEEKFMANQRWLTALNLKATYGIQGNALLNLSPELILQQQGVADIYNEYYSNISSIPNPQLSWERTRTWNLEMDMQLFNKVNVVVDYYSRRSNAVIQKDIAYENGLTSMKLNGGIVYNKGIEVTVNLTPINTKDFGLSFSVNSSKNWNTTGKSDFDVTVENYLEGNETMILKKGYSLGSMWSYAFAGLNGENGTPMFKNLEFSEENPYNGDPTTYLVYSGQKNPYFTGGLNLSIRYRSFTLGSSFALLLGGKKRLTSPYSSMAAGIYMPKETSNVSKDLAKRWKKPGDEKYTNIPGFIQGNQLLETPEGNKNMMDMWAQSDALVVNSSFLRCRNLTLGWRLNQKMAKKMRVSNLTVSASVNNLFVIASKRFNGFDPELDNSVMPKNYSLGLSVGF